MRRLPAVLLLLAAPGGAALLPHPPNSTPTFSSSHIDLTRTRPAAGPPAGVPFGPFALWNDAQLKPAAVAFTASQNYVSPENVVRLIANARDAGQKVILVLTGGEPKQYSTNGAF